VSGWLLDTNVLSELRRASPSRKVSAFVASQPLDSLYVSAVTFAEIRFGIELVTEPARRSDLTLWLDNKLRPMFDGRILELDEDVLLKWRLIIEDGRKRGHTFSHPDVLIAATAAHHDVTVVTRNIDEFEAAGVSVFNPWTGKTAAAR
jgi:toxin FitB